MRWRQRLHPTACIRWLLAALLAEQRGAAAGGNCSSGTNGSSASNCTNVTAPAPGLLFSGTRVIFRRGEAGSSTLTEVVAEVGKQGAPEQLVELKVGEYWGELRLQLEHEGATAVAHWANPQLRFVSGLASGDDHCGEQWALGSDRVRSPDFLPFTTLPLHRTSNNVSIGNTSWNVSVNLTFIRPGKLRLCFSHNGTFAPPSAELLHFNVTVAGLLDTCGGTCDLGQQRVECPANSTSLCSLRFGGVVGDMENSSSSWTPAFSASLNNETGEVLYVSTPTCGSGPPAPDVFGSGMQELGPLLEAAGGYMHLGLPVERSLAHGPATVAVCYCPDTSDRECTSYADYTQQVGLLLIFAAVLCDPSEGTDCTTQYDSAIVGHRFMLSVYCPPQGCRFGTGSRVKLIARSASANLPSWDPMHGCLHAPHLESWLPRGNCDSPTSCLLDGGERQDRRTWGSPGAWWAWEPEENPARLLGPKLNPGAERLDVRAAQDVDVCYCDGSCADSGAAWFKVGEVRMVEPRLAAAPTLVGAPGALQLARPPEDADALGLSGQGTVKLMADPDVKITLEDCNRAPNPTEQVTVRDAASSSGNLLVFEEGRRVVMDAPGIVAACYCSAPATQDSCGAGGFLLAGRFTVRGPVPGQSFEVSTHGLFHIKFAGHALEATDVLLLSESPCNAGGQQQAPAGTELVATGCPWACSGAQRLGNPPADNISTVLLTHATVGCDHLRGSCRSARITNFTSGANGTALRFESDPTLEDGDRIVIGGGVGGGTAGQLETLRGRFSFAGEEGSAGGPSYMVAHEVSRGADSQTWHIPLALTSSDAPAFTLVREGAEWSRHSHASTLRELLGPPTYNAVPALHVCWTAGSRVPGAWREVGTLTFKEPPSFPKAAIALVAPVSSEAVPAIVAFETGTQAYPVGTHGTALTLRFEDTGRLAPRTISGAQPATGMSRPRGSQGLCAQVLLETWSSQSDIGFPMPERCWFGTPYTRGGNSILEFEIEFEPQTGLGPNTKYQLALNVYAVSGVNAQDALLHIEARDDLGLRPNAAVEARRATLRVEGSKTADASGSRLTGLDVMSGNVFTPPGSSMELVELDGSGPLPISLRLTGDSAGVVGGSNLRIILWPLTQWALGTDVSAACEPPFQCSPVASAEALEPEVGLQRNSVLLTDVRATLGGAEVAISATSTPSLTLRGSGSITGGVFSARPAIFASNSAAGTHQYFQPTAGAAFHVKAAPIGTLLGSRGHGNAEPFPSAYNALYVRLFLPVSLPQGGNITIRSPGFFRDCGEASALPRLALLDNPLAHPGGALSQGSWNTTTVFAPLHPNRTCCNQTVLEEEIPKTCIWTYFVQEPAGLLAGSSAYVQVTVRNPPFPVHGGNASAIWQVSMHDSQLNLAMTANFTVPPYLLNQGLVADLPVIRPLMFAQTLPGQLLPAVQHTVQVFFSLSETIAPVGRLEVWSPQGFDFGNPCAVSDLADEYYRYGTGAISAKLDRLPIPQGCSGHQWPVGAPEHTIAKIGFGGPVQQGRRYAFGLSVRNPVVQSGEQRAAWTQQPRVWAVRAFDAAGYEVEGHDNAAALDGIVASNASQSWDLCAESMSEAPAFRWGTLLPYPVTLAVSHVTVLPLVFLQDLYAPVRFTAPLGYEWEQPRSTGGYWMSYPPGATAPMPGGLPTVSGLIYLQWADPILLRTGFTYGFRVPVQVPEWPQTSTAFYLEIGQTDTAYSPQRHPLGFVMAGPPDLRVVRDPLVDYMTGRVGEQQEVSIRVRTVTTVYPGEGFLFVGGRATVRLYCNCPASEYLTGLQCATLSGQMTGYLMLRLTATTSLAAGMYKFPFWCSNPAQSEDIDAWTLGTYEEPQNYPRVVPLDGEAIVPGFAVQPGMAAFQRLQASAPAGFDPRSRRRCGTILTFTLSNGTQAGRNFTSMRLRAPEGTLFAPQCLQEVFTSNLDAFGPGVGFPPTYSPLPPLHLCEGHGHIAYLHWKELVLPRVAYAFRVTPLNPRSAPVANVWTLEVDGQSSSMVDAIPIQAFHGVAVAFSSTGARMPGSAIGGNQSNRLRVSFAPTVEAGTFELTAPPGFDFGRHKLCSRMRLIGRSDQVPGMLSSTTFVPRLASCEALGLALRIVFDKAENWTMRTGATYHLDADILMPTDPTPVSETRQYHLLSWAVDGGFGDEFLIEAPQVWRAPTEFKVTNVRAEIYAPKPVEIDVRVTFSTTIGYKERIELQLPKRFTFDTQNSPCPATWQVPAIGPVASCICDAQTSICRVVFVLFDNRTWNGDDNRIHSPWAGGRPIRFSVLAMNPVSQPIVFENSFVITHFPPSRAINWTTPYGIGLYRSWSLISPVTGLRVSIGQGAHLRAGSSSTLHLTFVPSNDATILRLKGLEPAGWSFLLSVVCREGQAQALCRVPKTDQARPNVVELLDTNILSGERYVREIRNVQLAPIGGPTAFSLETFTQDSQGNWITGDQVERHDSFRLPGLLTSTDTQLRTVRAAMFPTDGLWAQLPPRLYLSEALVLWHFTLTQKADAGDYIAVEVVLDNSLELDLQSSGLVVLALHPEETAAGVRAVGDYLPITTEQVGPKELRLRLQAPLHVMPAKYKAYVSGKVLEDPQASGGRGATKFLNVSVCKQGEPLPTSTNDAIPPGANNLPVEQWTAISPLPDFRINAQGAAPLAQVMVTGYSPSSLNYPTVTLIAPYGVRILSPCAPTTCASVSTNFSGTGRQAAVRLVTTGDFSLRVELPGAWDDDSWVALTPKLSSPEDQEGSAIAAPLWQASRDIIFRFMPTGIAYPAVGNVQGVRMTLSFQPGIGAALVLSSGMSCFVKVHVPAGYKIRCGAYFRTITVPVLSQASCTEEQLSTRAVVTISAPDAVRLQSTAELVFAFGLEIPSETPQPNSFEVVLLTPLNVTVDANNVVPGLPIPPERLRSSVVLEVSGFESLAWLRSWTAAAHARGAFGDGIAEALQVAATAVVVDSVEARLKAARRLDEEPLRALAATRGEILVNFSTSLSARSGQPNNIDVLQPRFEASSFGASVATSVSSAAERLGLAALSVGSAVVVPPAKVIPPNVTNPSIRWTSSKAGDISQVAIGMMFRIPTTGVRAILFILPQGFSHELQAISDLQVRLNGAIHTFPVASEWGNAWIDARTRHTVRVDIASGVLVQEGGYTFQFPVRLPQDVPDLNVWKVCLCTSNECDAQDHPSVITVFALPGFRIGEVYPTLPVTAKAWGRSFVVAPTVIALLATFLLREF